MLNKDMDTKPQEMQKDQAEKPMVQEKKPDVTAGIYVAGHIKIHDPESGEVFVENRA
jgi:hypothetical protein